jgi:predicted NBD/HSP70 family sugar kinase
MKKRFILGLDVGGTRCKIGLVDISAGAIKRSDVFPTDKYDVKSFFSTIYEKCCQINKSSENSAEGMGIGVLTYVFADGKLDSTWGYVPFLDYLHLAHRMKELTGLPCRICNDAEAVARAEAIYGAGCDYSRVLTLTLGTGIGVGFMVDGKSQNNGAAIHLAGHIKVRNGGEHSGCLDNPPCYCAVSGCFESSCSGTSLTRLIKYQFGNDNAPDNKTIFEMAKSGDPKALYCVDWFLDVLVCALNQYIYIFCPDVIVLGGGLSNFLKPWIKRINSGLQAHVYSTQHTKVLLARLKEKGGILGAAALFTENKAASKL